MRLFAASLIATLVISAPAFAQLSAADQTAIQNASAQTGVPIGLLQAVQQQETGGSPNPDTAVSSTGAQGLFQILPSTAGQPGFGVTPLPASALTDPTQNSLFAAQYIQGLANANGGDYAAAINRYSGGTYQLAQLNGGQGVAGIDGGTGVAGTGTGGGVVAGTGGGAVNGVTVTAVGTTYQQLFTSFNAAVQTAAGGIIGNVLGGLNLLIVAAATIALAFYGWRLAWGYMDSGTASRKIVTLIVVGAISTAATFSQFVTQPLTVGIPNNIAQLVSGGAAATAPAQFDLLDAKVALASGEVLAQMPTLDVDRIAVWGIELAARLLICLSFICWACAQLIIQLIPILIALTIWTWIFDALRHIGERAVSVGIALLVGQALILITASIVVSVETAYAAQHITALQAASVPNSNLSMNAGDMTFTSASEGLAGPAVGATSASTLNTTVSTDAMIGQCIALFLGFGMLGIVSAIAAVFGVIGFGTGNITQSAISAGTIGARTALRAVGFRGGMR